MRRSKRARKRCTSVQSSWRALYRAEVLLGGDALAQAQERDEGAGRACRAPSSRRSPQAAWSRPPPACERSPRGRPTWASPLPRGSRATRSAPPPPRRDRATSGSTRPCPRSADQATLRPAMPASQAARNDAPPSAGSEWRSRSSGPAIASSIRAASRTVRVIGPVCESVSQPGKPGPCGHAPEGRLEAVDPAERRGDADGAAAVGAHRERPEARRHRRAGAAAGAARGERGIPRIAGDPEERAVGDALVAELRRIGLADDDGAGAASGAPPPTASSSGTWSASSREPAVVRTRRVKSRSLMETGTP